MRTSFRKLAILRTVPSNILNAEKRNFNPQVASRFIPSMNVARQQVKEDRTFTVLKSAIAAIFGIK